MSECSLECGNCRVFACATGDASKRPAFCPTKTRREQIDASKKLYVEDPETKEMSLAASRTEAKGFGKWTRVEDTIDFAKRMGYKKLGIATCIGLIPESSILTRILVAKGFEVVSVCCRCGAIPKEDVGLLDSEKAMPGRFESTCNPVGQAFILNDEKTDLNILVGLCVGHDALFIKHSEAPVTVLIAKDRHLFHNPVVALHGANTIYFRNLLQPEAKNE